MAQNFLEVTWDINLPNENGQQPMAKQTERKAYKQLLSDGRRYS